MSPSRESLIESRRPIWIAMSALWLDTQLDDHDIADIARALTNAGISEAEADRIFRLELAPFLGWNHWSVAGVWTGFDPEWICSEAARRLQRWGLFPRIAARLRLSTYAALPDWERVKRLAYATGPPGITASEPDP